MRAVGLFLIIVGVVAVYCEAHSLDAPAAAMIAIGFGTGLYATPGGRK